jgi:hypothetical protein
LLTARTGCDTRGVGIVYRIDQGLDCTIVVWDGDITADDHIQHLLRLAADPDWPPARHLTDLTTVGEVTLPDPLLMDALVEGSPMRDEIVKVIIVRPGFLGEHWMQDSGASVTGVPEVCTNVAAACVHLGLDPTVMRSTLDELRSPLNSTRLVDPPR